MATKATKQTVNRLDVISAKGDILRKIAEALSAFEKDTLYEYKCVGKEDEQARDWRTDELLWEDDEHTIPMYRSKYDYVKVSDNEMTDGKRAALVAIEEVKAYFDKIIF